jgi:hypothetical protein
MIANAVNDPKQEFLICGSRECEWLFLEIEVS